MADNFLVAMREALSRVLNAETPEARKEAEDAMALLIRNQYNKGRSPADSKMRQAGE